MSLNTKTLGGYMSMENFYTALGVGAVALLVLLCKKIMDRLSDTLIQKFEAWLQELNVTVDAVKKIGDDIESMRNDMTALKSDLEKSFLERFRSLETVQQAHEVRLKALESLSTPRVNDTGTIGDRRL